MSTLTIVLIVAFVILLQLAPVYVIFLGAEQDEEGTVIPRFNFLRTYLIGAVLLICVYGFNRVKIISGRMFEEAMSFCEELEKFELPPTDQK